MSGSATPSLTQQTFLPTDFGSYDYLTQFTVGAIPVTRVDNVSGGVTVSIAVA